MNRQLSLAAEHVRSGKFSIRAAADKHGLKRGKVHLHVKNPVGMRPRAGAPTMFSPLEEQIMEVGIAPT